MLGDLVGQLDRCRRRARPSGGCARAASPSPRATARRSGRSAGRSRSGRSRRSAPGPHRLRTTRSASGAPALAPGARVLGVGDAAGPGATSGAASAAPARRRGSQRRRPGRSACSARISSQRSASSPPSARELRVDRRAREPSNSTCSSSSDAGRRRSGTSCEWCSARQRDASITTRARRRGQRVQPQRDPLDRAEPAARAAEELAEVVAGDVLDDLPAGVRAQSRRRSTTVTPSTRSRIVPKRWRSGPERSSSRHSPSVGSPGGSSESRWPCSASGALQRARARIAARRRSRSGRPARTRARRRRSEAAPRGRPARAGARGRGRAPRRTGAASGRPCRGWRCPAGSKARAQPRHRGEVGLAEQQRHRARLVGADAVLAGDRAAGVDAGLEDPLGELAAARSASPGTRPS